MNRSIHLLLLVKSIDGGTGSHLLSLLKLKKISTNLFINITAVVLEKPHYRKIYADNKFIFLRKEGFYPQKYCLSYKNLRNILQELYFLKNIIVQRNIDTILSIDLHCNFLSLINKLIFFREKKVIATTHNNLVEVLEQKSSRPLNFILKKVIAFFYNQADILVCSSRELSVSLTNNFNIIKQIHVIYYGIKQPIQIESRSFNNRGLINIISVGRLVEQKDFFTLIDAFNIVQNKISNCKLSIVGDGQLKNLLIAKVKRLDLSEKIRFFGWSNNIDSYFKRSDVFVFSSKREGFGYVLIEAMKFALPIISTKTPYGPKEILGNGKYGILIPIGDAKRIAEAIYNLISNKNTYEYYSKQSINRIRFFTETAMLNKYKRLILQLLS